MPKHLLTGAEFDRPALLALLDQAESLRQERHQNGGFSERRDLHGRTLITLYEKPSLRTHISFSVAMQELGGSVVDSFSAFRKKEEPEDVARVLGGYGHAVMVRTYDQSILERMATKSPIPVINGLSDSHHPCQIFADLLTLKQSYGDLNGLTLTYVGDGNNILHSLLLLAPFLGVNVRYACPRGYEPNAFILRTARARAKEGTGTITGHSDALKAAEGAHALYTDVWTSMGFEKEEAEREQAFAGFQLNEELYAKAAPNALIMHCMPMVRGKEISEGVADHVNSALFRQSENRLHVQKAILLHLMVG